MKKKKGWDTVPDPAQKVQEAQLAFGKMRETVAYTASIPQRANFRLYFNGFLEASYSVTISLDKTKKGWRKNLSQPECELVNFMVDQRGTEIHNAGAVGLRTEMKWYRASRVKGLEMTYPPALYMSAGINNQNKHQVGVTEYYFETRTGRKELIPTCNEYLAVLARQI